MPQFLLKIFIVSCLIILSACVSQAPQQPLELSPAEQQENLAALSSWQFNGKIALRSPSQNNSGYIDWQQSDEQFSIRLYGPLGSGTTTVVGSPAEVTITTGGKQTSSTNPADLLFAETGWLIPINELRYWAIGLPSPNLPVDLLEQDIFSTKLAQAGWTMSYSNHQWIENQWLPGKIKLSTQDRSIILLAKQWNITSDDYTVIKK